MARGPMMRRTMASVENNKDTTKKTSLALEKRDWENAICSVCMESPHDAVLLLCSSHNNGCRPYMCATGPRFSNCLDQFKQAYAREGPKAPPQLSCPLCRGQVKGWTVVEPAREYLNKKKRTCMQDKCLFRGTYKKLRKHVRDVHGSTKPRRIDPEVQKRWNNLEYQRERADVMSMIRSSMRSGVILGDYVIGSSDSDHGMTDDEFFDEDFGRGARQRFYRHPVRMLRRYSYTYR